MVRVNAGDQVYVDVREMQGGAIEVQQQPAGVVITLSRGMAESLLDTLSVLAKRGKITSGRYTADEIRIVVP